MPTIQLAGLPVTVLRPCDGSDHTLDGVSSRHAHLVVVGELVVVHSHVRPVQLFDEPELRQQQAGDICPPMVLVRTHGAHISYALLPWTARVEKDPAGVLARHCHGGNFAAVGEDHIDAWSAYMVAAGTFAVPIRDRNEARWRRVRSYPPPGLNTAGMYAPLVDLVGPIEAPEWRFHAALGRRDLGTGDLILRYRHNETGHLLNLGLDGTAYHVAYPIDGDRDDPVVTEITRSDALDLARP